jgi:hypothetical protein
LAASQSPATTSTKPENHSAVRGSICKKTAPSTNQTCENGYFAPAKQDALSNPSEFFTVDWVAWSKDSAVNYPIQDDPVFVARFDLSMSYKRSADLWDSYVPPRQRWLEAMEQPTPSKTERAPLVMFQSAGFNKSLRSEFALELMRDIQVDSSDGI